MSPFLQLVLELVIILLAAKAAGYIATRLDHPSVLGELLAGLLLGPSLLNILHMPFINNQSLGDTISELSELGVLLLMFVAGLELHMGELAGNRKVAFIASISGLLFSICLGWLVGRLFGMTQVASILLGVALGATSVSISARTLMELGVLRSKSGLSLLGAAVVDDILSILAFAVFLAVASGVGGIGNLIWLTARMVLFLAIAVAFGIWVLPRLSRWAARLAISQGILAFALIILLVYGLTAEVAGHMAAMIGTFIAGLMFARTPEKELIEPGMAALAYGLFVPIFFINIGLTVNLRELSVNAIWLSLIATLVAIAGKLLGAALGARVGGFMWREAWRLGAGMAARGEVTLIIATAGIKAGLVDEQVLSALVAVVLLTILVTPPMLRAFFRTKGEKV